MKGAIKGSAYRWQCNVKNARVEAETASDETTS